MSRLKGTNGRVAEVTDSGFMKTVGPSVEAVSHAASNPALKDVYIFATDFLNITTTGTEYGILYFKNNSIQDFKIEEIRTCSIGTQEWRIYLDVTGGTLVTDETASTITNTNTSSSKNIGSSVVYKGGQGKTVTGSLLTQYIQATGHYLWDNKGSVVIAPGGSIALAVSKGSTGNTCAHIKGYFTVSGTAIG